MNEKWENDPHSAREALSYTNPIPSREFILQHLESRGSSATYPQLVVEFGLIDPERLEALRRRLRAMVHDGQLVLHGNRRYGLVQNSDLITGSIIAHPDGFGFVVPDDGRPDMYLPEHDMRAVFHGDKVLIHLVKGRRDRLEGRVVKVLEHRTTQIVGRYFETETRCFVIPDNKRLTQDIVIPREETLKAMNGQIVVVNILTQPSFRTRPTGKIVEILGDHLAPGMEINVALRAHDIPHAFPKNVLQEAKDFGSEVSAEDKKNRRDLTHLSFVTIDGDDAKDFDDAVYSESLPKGGWRLYVAIADVSHYVKIGSELDREATRRGTSIYFPGRVVPMLPYALSNELCSLKPDVDRLSLVCEMEVGERGELKKYEFYPAVIRSKARLTYDQVYSWFQDSSKAEENRHAKLWPHLQQLYKLYVALKAARDRRGALDLEMSETKIIFDKQLKIEKIIPLKRHDIHCLIEECMILANVAAAKFVTKNKISMLYRTHAGPNTEKLSGLREYLKEFNLGLRGGDQPASKDYAELIAVIKNRPDTQLIHTVLLRSLKQAVYSPENEGHFGLGLEDYAHFTSPIRRYPDLLLHRAIYHIVEKTPYPYGLQAMLDLGESSSVMERRADEATRDAVDWLKCEYMQDKVGDEFQGTISTVTGFGFFVALNDIYVEGLVHVTSLRNDHYTYEPGRHLLRGRRTGKTYRLGDTVTVKVARVDLDNRLMDFMLPDAHLKAEKPAAKQEKPPKTEKKEKKRRPRRRKKAKK